jgi:putative transposase
MIGLEDRCSLAHDIHTAHRAGARLRLACETAGINARTLQRWKARQDLIGGDGRPQAVRPMPSHALSMVERAEVLRVANEPRFAAVPPARIVPMLADEGVYLASESSFARVLRAHGQSRHRGRAKAPHAGRPPTTHIATAPRQVWCWDMTYLPATVMGRWFHLYLILDLYSRKIVGWEVHDSDHAEHATHLVRRGTIAPSWLLVTRCTSTLARSTRRDGQARRATGRTSAPSPSIPNATASSRRIRRASINSRWLHE